MCQRFVLCCYPEGHQQAREMGRQEPCEVHHKETPSPASGQEQPYAPVYPRGHPDGKQLGRKGPGILVDTKLTTNQ